ncbi:MAG TPA: YaaL family protein [Acetivibrio sp.]|nr:YaaL family protein [Acetivibrio sp.]HPT90438.1 YaaL family protein [Acetivibrio sp.]HQA56536.1 YaaL family protein [Acetivibrio sp.]
MDINAQKNHAFKMMKNTILSIISNILKEKDEIVYTDLNSEKENLIESINDAKKEWLSARNNFDHAVDSDIIDYYIYKIKAYQIRYEYLLKKAKEKGISV